MVSILLFHHSTNQSSKMTAAFDWGRELAIFRSQKIPRLLIIMNCAWIVLGSSPTTSTTTFYWSSSYRYSVSFSRWFWVICDHDTEFYSNHTKVHWHVDWTALLLLNQELASFEPSWWVDYNLIIKIEAAVGFIESRVANFTKETSHCTRCSLWFIGHCQV